MKAYTLVDGVPADGGRVFVDQDDSLFLGHGAFETLRTYNGVLFQIEAHMERLMGSRSAASGVRTMSAWSTTCTLRWSPSVPMPWLG